MSASSLLSPMMPVTVLSAPLSTEKSRGYQAPLPVTSAERVDVLDASCAGRWR
jgi:hypothetical protein